MAGKTRMSGIKDLPSAWRQSEHLSVQQYKSSAQMKILTILYASVFSLCKTMAQVFGMFSTISDKAAWKYPNWNCFPKVQAVSASGIQDQNQDIWISERIQ